MAKTLLMTHFVAAGAVGFLVLLQRTPSAALAETDAPPAVAEKQQVARKDKADKKPPAAKDDGSLAAFAEFERLMAMKPPPEDSKERRIAKEVARKFGETYANLKYLSMEAEITELPKYKVATVKATMRPGQYTMKASFDGKLLYEQTFDHGKVSEHKLPYNGVPDQRVNYEVHRPEQSHGPLDTRLNDGVPYHMGCNIGSFFFTWLGRGCSSISLKQERIENGWYIGEATVDGFSCQVFFYQFPNNPTMATKYYIDKGSSLLRKWIQFDSLNENGENSPWVRVQRFTNIVARGVDATSKPTPK